MSTAVSVVVPMYDLPDEKQAAQIASARKAEALKHFDAIKKACELASTSSLRIGYHAHILKRDGLFSMLGFEHEEEARRAIGVGKSTWFNCIRLAEAFNGLEEEHFVSMKLLNAVSLADLPESKRLSREWIRMAGSMATGAFQQRVDEELDGRAKVSDGREQGVVLRMPMPLSRKKNVQEGLQEYAEKIGIDQGDTGRALEMLLVEKKGEVSLIESITNAIQHIRVAKEVRNSGLSADEALEKVNGILDEMALGFHAALKAIHGEGTA